MRPATSRPAAADVGKYRSAEEHLVDGAAVDIADTADNLRDGVRVASAGATWMAIVYGLGGYRWRGTRFAPVLPTRSARLRFPLLIRGSRLQVDIEEHQVTYSVGFGKWWYLTSRCGRSEVVPGLTGTSSLLVCSDRGAKTAFGTRSGGSPARRSPRARASRSAWLGHRPGSLAADRRRAFVVVANDGGVVDGSGQPQDVVLLVDIANVMGSRPDGWWRGRPAAATRLLRELEPLNGAEVSLPDEPGTARISEVYAVVEGAANRGDGPEAVSALRADRDGDVSIARR